MIRFIARHPVAFLIALALHIILLWWMATNRFSDFERLTPVNVAEPTSQTESEPSPSVVPAQSPPMRTFAVDASAVRAQLEKIKQEEAQKKREAERLKQQAEAEKQRLQQLKAEQKEALVLTEQAKRQAAAQRKKAEEARQLAQVASEKAEAERQKIEQARQAAQEAKQAAEQARAQQAQAQQLLEQAKQAKEEEEAERLALQAEIQQREAEKRRIEAEALQARLQREQEQAEAELAKQLAEAESQKRAAAKAREMQNLRETYISSITAAVKDNWRTAARVSDEAQCVIAITQTPKGMVSKVTVKGCNSAADEQFKKDAERAVLRAQPLPQPPVEELFERNIEFIFKP
ncbi:cell envelope integrity protein TolA [Thiomicrospira sp. WB1]|uniref:cell envelope integrity protein TolA n=1 Tax=Thiomicrospira sp. WB1 TaxID=1685380 RepID=UPI0007464C20|nr:cell envelope integrity protein TolA [Thiomicrospira sp. WB1]KUJ72942.1 protein TolA [Thiomicrospira sp. WB1]